MTASIEQVLEQRARQKAAAREAAVVRMVNDPPMRRHLKDTKQARLRHLQAQSELLGDLESALEGKRDALEREIETVKYELEVLREAEERAR